MSLKQVLYVAALMSAVAAPFGGHAAIVTDTLATVGGLYILIEVLGPVSGAHFNPAVSLVMTLRGALPKPLFAP
jgi:glycerol uptake facilitator-like aquaporin